MQSSHRVGATNSPPPERTADPADPVDFPDGAGQVSLREWVLRVIERSFLLLAVYVLSIGPMYWHWYGARFAGGSILLAAFYEPLIFIAQLFPAFGRWMDWYVSLWIS